MKKLSCTIVLSVFLVCSFASFLQAATFSKADLAGKWRGFWLESVEGPNGVRYTLDIDVVIDSSGSFSSGSWQSSGGLYGNVTGGSLNIDSNGYVTGDMEYDHQTGSASGQSYTVSIEYGQLDMDKEIIPLAFKKSDLPNDRLAVGLLCKYLDTGMSADALAGNWSIALMEDDPDDPGVQDDTVGPYWMNANIEVGASSSGDWRLSDSTTGTISTVNWRMDVDGLLGGAFVIGPQEDEKNSWTMQAGQMDLQANVAAIKTTRRSDSLYPNSDYRPLAGGFMLRTGGTGFMDSDMAGTWALFHTQIYNSSQMYWVYSELKLDSSGNLIRGSWSGDDSGETGTYTGGAFSVENDGELSGMLSNSLGRGFIVEGYLGRTKNYGIAVAKSGTSYAETLFFIRKPDSINNIPSTMLLLNN